MAVIDPLGGIRTFIAAARAGSFTAAAAELDVSKSAVGKSIARLEERLRIKLFHRTTRRLALTVDGEAYYATCAAALGEIQAMEDTLAARSGVPGGRLRIDLPMFYGRRVVLPVLLRMSQRYPQVQLTVTFSDDLIDPVKEGVDLLIRFGPLPDASALVARSLGRQQLVTCAAPGYLAASGTPATVPDLMRHQCIVGYRRGQPLGWSFYDAGGKVTRCAPPPTHQFDDGEAILGAALAGCGLCQLPRSLLEANLADGSLVAVLGDVSAYMEVNLLWPRTRHVLPKVRWLVDELVCLREKGELDCPSAPATA
ncbi:LysR family transcriptional regulator [Telluria beijingensis]|uniref:LysR family transcriptional regulator n=1 Tax=Telluria beijingensis TaxID=3068633 RepID=UPI002795C8E5|nr:LysR family transcriptional regulator [Massilia sp. REN29]